MAGQLEQAVEQAVEIGTGQAGRISGRQTAGGGCINNAQVIQLDDGRRFFLKSNPDPLPRMFLCEAEGLRALGEAGSIRVPGVIGTGGGSDDDTVHSPVPFIVLEAIETGRPAGEFFERFGREFALLHQQTRTDRFGFHHDNYLGSTPQPNAWETDWVTFFRKHRLGFQLELARRNGYSDPALDRAGDRLLDRLEELIGGPDEPPCLLHGDLWSGNYMSDTRGEPVLIDPAAYCGRREADLAMTMLFGGFNDRFYRAYEEVWPLASGSGERIEIYKLYHLLNHLNLFGGGYYTSCMGILRRFT